MRQNKIDTSTSVHALTEAIDFAKPTAIYLQLENQIRFAIAAGRLQPGDRLPSSSDLAKRLQVNLNTVTKVYHDLELMGCVYALRGRGVFVAEDAAGKCRQDVAAEVVSRLHQCVAEAKAAGLPMKEVQAAVREEFRKG